jgi:hypothetical protein
MFDALLEAVGVGWMAATYGVRWLNDISDTGVDRWYRGSSQQAGEKPVGSISLQPAPKPVTTGSTLAGRRGKRRPTLQI